MINFFDRSGLKLEGQTAKEKTDTMLVISCERSINAMTPAQIAVKKEHESKGGMVVLKPNQGASSFEFLNKDGSKVAAAPVTVEEPKQWREWDYNTASWQYN